MEIKNIISNYFNPFSIENKKALEVLFPLERGNVDIEVVSKKEIQASIRSYFHFDVGEIVSFTSSDFPSNIKFYSYTGQIIPNFSFGTTIYNDDRRPFKIKSAYHGEKGDYLFSQGVNVTFKVLPSSNEVIDRSFIGIKTRTDIYNNFNTKFLTFEFKSDKQKLKFEGLIKNYFKRKQLIQTGFSYSFRNYKFRNNRLYLFSTTNFGKTQASTIYFLRNSSLNFVFQRNIDDYILRIYDYCINTFNNANKKKRIKNENAKETKNKNKKRKNLFSNYDLSAKNINSGLLLGINNLGQSSFGPKFTGKISTKFDFDQDSSLHLIYGIHGELGAKITMMYKDFINFQFTWTSTKGNTGRENKYGAVITFDLCGKKISPLF